MTNEMNEDRHLMCEAIEELMEKAEAKGKEIGEEIGINKGKKIGEEIGINKGKELNNTSHIKQMIDTLRQDDPIISDEDIISFIRKYIGATEEEIRMCL